MEREREIKESYDRGEREEKYFQRLGEGRWLEDPASRSKHLQLWQLPEDGPSSQRMEGFLASAKIPVPQRLCVRGKTQISKSPLCLWLMWMPGLTMMEWH